jgi:diadenosine tetraphosphate (Ap4A) HIT family hydrolase
MASAEPDACDICRGEAFDVEFGRTLVWQDDLWRLSTSVVTPILGFSYLEPIRHIPYISDLDGPEAESFGPTLARITGLLKGLTDADIVYALMFGDHVAHLHVNLVPHRRGDGLTGGSQLLDPASPALAPDVQEAFVARLRAAARDALT